jgi:hypothetical protein
LHPVVLYKVYFYSKFFSLEISCLEQSEGTNWFFEFQYSICWEDQAIGSCFSVSAFMSPSVYASTAHFCHAKYASAKLQAPSIVWHGVSPPI